MTRFFAKHQRKIACFFMLNFALQLLLPLRSLAITSGPSQPEMHGFQPIGSSDMVDLFSGDFKYNIPLMDVGGYPLNISYNGGTGIDDDASWVGNGWSLTPGVVNRQMKALPDDFKGDAVEKNINIKSKKKIAISGDFKPDFMGWEVFKTKKFSSKGGVGSFRATLYKDNYYGWGATLGINSSLDVQGFAGGKLTAGLGLSTDSRDGAGVSPSLNLEYANSKVLNGDKMGLNLGFDYNSRQGITSQTLGLSYSPKHKASEIKEITAEKDSKGNWNAWVSKGGNTSNLGGSASFVDNGVMTYTPTVDIPRTSLLSSVSLHLGGELTGLKGEIGVEGSYYIEGIPKNLRSRAIPAYGFLYAEEPTGDDHSNTLVDVNREKDIPYFKGTPILPIPVLTNDNFNVTSQNGSGQFKLRRAGSGIGHDPYLRTTSGVASLGADIGAGLFVNLGIHGYANQAVTVSNKWTDNNANSYQHSGDYKRRYDANPYLQHAVFKKSGEMTQIDQSYYDMLGKDNAVKINITPAGLLGGPTALQSLSDNGNNYPVPMIESAHREKQTSNFSYLTGGEASLYGLERDIISYNFVPTGPTASFGCSILNPNNVTSTLHIGRADNYRQPHHISEISVLDNKGTRMIYGIPVYNKETTEVTFSVGNPDETIKRSGIIGYTPGVDNSADNTNGRDNYFSKDKIPAYATSFLLTAILSPDYQDRTGNGVSDDDYGSAVKFNYTRLTDDYKWRTPYSAGGDEANYNDALKADDWDNKGNYTYGKKEIWYMHSIESKNFVAIFYTSDREDGLGVAGENGIKDASIRQRKLDSIALFAKPDFKANGSHAVPIKVAHFEYDYSTGSGYPNYERTLTSVTPAGQSGKLTLLRIYFTYGKNQKGKTNPYQFFYKMSVQGGSMPAYQERQTDRWGTYKDAAYNPGYGSSGLKLTNSEYPYTLQSNMTNDFAGLWNLNLVRLPSGGEVLVDYESDDYAYVQNKRAARMFQVYAIGRDGATTSDFITANEIYVKSDKNYLHPDDLVKGMKYLYGRFYMDLRKAGGGTEDFVPCYAEIDGANAVTAMGNQGGGVFGYRIKIKLVAAEGIGEQVNPFAVASWQYLRNNLPHLAYPGYDNNTAGNSNIGANILGAVRALGQAVLNLKELFENYNHKFRRIHYANHVADMSRSWVRLTEPDGFKKGGGHRVKKVTIRDNWGNMANRNGNDHYENNEYGQIYEYTMTEDGQTISSGVASYEPGLGGDENPFKTPVFYSKEVKWGLDYNTYMEEPLGESYMPSPTVGYRKVTVRSFGARNASSGAQSQNELGYTENEFYTAKEFPLIVTKNGPAAYSYNPKLLLSLVVNVSISNMATTQGVTVIQNDMHGKPKAMKTYDKNGYLLSSSEYTYKTKNPNAAIKELSNEVDLLKGDETTGKGIIGQDIEFYSDMRYQRTSNVGIRAGVYFGATLLGFLIPTGFGAVNVGANISDGTFNSASAIKLITRYGIVEKVTKMENGSYATTENLLWDPETGEILLTKTNNEYDQPVYNLTYPAHWAYKAMGPSYQNGQSVLTDVSTQPNGSSNAGEVIATSSKLELLNAGDELIDITGGNFQSRRYWVIEDGNVSTNPPKYLIDMYGHRADGLSQRTFKIIRSGLRNMAQAGIASISCLKNPVEHGYLQVDASLGILDAKAVAYSDKWNIPVMGMLQYDGEQPYESCGTEEINPYFHQLLGVWRPQASLSYLIRRDNQLHPDAAPINKAGSYLDFSPYYYYSAGDHRFLGQGLQNGGNWVWGQQSKFYSAQGEELESEDALHRFTSARFGYNNLLPIAVGKNTRALEMHYDGFEDYYPSTNCSGQQPCILPHVGFSAETMSSHVVTTCSHTGKYSFKVTGNSSVNFTASTSDYANLDNMLSRPNGIDYRVDQNDLAAKFMPKVGGRYILSLWIKDSQPTTYTSNVNISIGNASLDLSNLGYKPAIVEGWKRVEIPFEANASTLTLNITASSEDIFIDDVRVFPAEGQIKSFCYDAVTQRLMAELDENNFATLYEYDDEGTLIRVKKETERGVKTIKESRQYIRKTF